MLRAALGYSLAQFRFNGIGGINFTLPLLMSS
jgi:hypothetical protein